eukprot:8671761-Lingulodinium_polyedra.AAC.1
MAACTWARPARGGPPASRVSQRVLRGACERPCAQVRTRDLCRVTVQCGVASRRWPSSPWRSRPP